MPDNTIEPIKLFRPEVKNGTLLLFLIFLPTAYASYFFHEFGHWIVGEVLGNDMVYTLNYVWPRSGHYIKESDNLYSSIGGPAFTIILSLIFLLLIEKFKNIYLYPVVFFQLFLRFFSLVFGGFGKQDEARISALLNIGTYTTAIIVLVILFLFSFRASYRLRIDFKSNNIFIFLSTVSDLLVIGTSKLIL